MSMNKPPVISVIIQTRETPFMILKRCIQSIRTQSYPHVEILLLDSNETDSPYKETIQEEKEFFTGITLLELPETKEFVHGKNAALDACHGEYITFISAQDIMPQKRLEQLFHAFKKDLSCNAIYTDMTVQQSNVLEHSDFELLAEDFEYLAQLVFHRDCFEWIGTFDEDLVAHCDEDIWFRLRSLKLVHHLSSPETTISVCPDCYYGYTPLDAAIGYRQLGVKYKAIFDKNKKGRKQLYQKIAAQYKKAGVIHRYIQFAVKAMVTKNQ